jgi:hypothetical protein
LDLALLDRSTCVSDDESGFGIYEMQVLIGHKDQIGKRRTTNLRAPADDQED